MGAIFWILAGAMTGFVCSKLVYRDAKKLMRDVLLGILGALLGGIVYRQLGHHEPHQLSSYGILIAITGSVVLLVLYRMLGSRQNSDT
jgi:uncharacterized membrane protein YeaQ/YmgE (transglycosylase-associated protein family)